MFNRSLLVSILVVAVTTISTGTPAYASTLIDFDDLPVDSGAYIPQGYNQFTWSGEFGDFSWVNGGVNAAPGGFARSNPIYAWSNGGYGLSLTDGLFNIESLWVMAWDGFGDPGDPIVPFMIFEGKLSGSTVFSASFEVNTLSYTQIDLNFTGIDTFSMAFVDPTLPGSNTFLVDDITFSRGAPIPEPASLAMWSAIALGGLGLAYRRRKRQRA